MEMEAFIILNSKTADAEVLVVRPKTRNRSQVEKICRVLANITFFQILGRKSEDENN